MTNYEKNQKYIKIKKFSDTIEKIRLTNKQKNLVGNLIFEISELQTKVNKIIGIDSKIFLIPQLMLEGESSSLIEGTRTLFEDFAYDLEEINNIPSWETRNLINLYEKYLLNDYYLNNFIFSANSIAQMHLELYEFNPKSKFKMVYDPSEQIKKVKPGKILSNDNKPNFISSTPNIEQASVILLKPSLKNAYLEDLMKTLGKLKNDRELIIDHLLIMHPIFEAIHPFSDGNGRLGRLLNAFVLKHIYQKLNFPIFLSEVFLERKEDYMKYLKNVQLENDFPSWNQWNSFFIDVLIKSKRKMQSRTFKIIELWKETLKGKATSTQVRNQITKLFFKYYKIKKAWTLKKIQKEFPKLSQQTVYNDWNIVVSSLKIQNINGDDYYSFEKLREILRK